MSIPPEEPCVVHAVTPGKVGMWVFLVTDALSFGGLLIGYAGLRAWSAAWPVPSTVLDVPLTAINTFVLICSSVTMVLAVAASQDGDRARTMRWLAATVAGGVAFLSVQAYEYHHLISHGFTLTSSTFGGTFFALTGFHGAHVLSGVIYLTVLLIGVARGSTLGAHETRIEIAGLFWHFVDLIWVLIFTFVYLI